MNPALFKNRVVSSPSEKIFSSLQELAELRAELRDEGIRVGLTNGCFDLLHRGHAQYLRGARLQADFLIVLLNSDDSVRRLKGPSRPINNEQDRAWLLASLEFVDAVLVFGSPRCDREIAVLRPDVYIKGADYTVEKLDPAERAALQECHAEIAFVDLVAGLSSTNLLKKSALT